jgi:glycosyltransferase involved in cell wall biosynthesis
MSARVPDATIVVSRDLADHYRRRYGRATWHVPNGVADPTRRVPDAIRRRFGLLGGDYVLFVGRLVPEKAPDLLLRAFSDLDGDTRLVLAGGSSFTDDFVRDLRSRAASDPRVILPGYVYGELLEELYSNASVFVLPSLLEGLPLTLLEAASYGIPVVASDIPPHVEILGSDGPGRRLVRTGDESDLARTLANTLSAQIAERAGADAFGRTVLATYRWDEVAEATEEVYRSVTSRTRRS